MCRLPPKRGATCAILVSFWRVAGMPSDSGTPTEWLVASHHFRLNWLGFGCRLVERS